MIFSNVNFKSLINLDFFSSNIVVSVEVAFVSVRTKKWGESRKEVEMVGAEAEVREGG